MFGKVKQYFGIEGVKIELDIPESVAQYKGKINGSIRFSSMNSQTVSFIKVKMVERYTRGRGKDKRIDEYELGQIELNQSIEVIPDTPVELPFTLPFESLRSEVEEFARKNFIFKGIANTAKLAYGAKFEYFIIAEAKVKGTALPPFVKIKIDLS